MRVAILGLGLIGGSIARALAATGVSRPSVAAWTPAGRGPASALAAGVIDLAATSPEAALDGADLVILAAPASEILGLLGRLAGPWRSALDADAVLTDVASTKGAIVNRAATLGLRFVGGHPMAGRETNGFAASSAHLLVDRPWVIVPSGDEAAVGRVEDLATAVGARPLRMTASDHDSAVAAISHLPLIVAAALVEAVAGGPTGERDDWPTLATLAATGWRDMTRLARGDVAMGAGIGATNGPEIAARIRDLMAVLEGWSAALSAPDGPDEAAIADRLRVARERLIATDP
jgi:prephenate dehydrogenase